MKNKNPYKIPKRLEELTDNELETVWWRAFRRDELSTVYCDPAAFRAALIKALYDHN